MSKKALNLKNESSTPYRALVVASHYLGNPEQVRWPLHPSRLIIKAMRSHCEAEEKWQMRQLRIRKESFKDTDVRLLLSFKFLKRS